MIVQPRVYRDRRGYFLENYNKQKLEELGIDIEFVQDNLSMSKFGVIRGLHYQLAPYAQTKLVSVSHGKVLDVVVDLRQGSLTFGHSLSIELSHNNNKQLLIPPGFAHGFVVLTDTAEFLYKTTDYWAPEFERCIRWDDDDLSIDWQYAGEPLVSEKDAIGSDFKEADIFE